MICSVHWDILCRRRFQRASKALAGGQHFGKPLPSDGVIDGNSVTEYQQLSRAEQFKVAKEVGTTRAMLLEVLAQLVSANSFF